MSGSSYGTIFKITTFGESHGKGLGVIVDGVPSKLPLSESIIQKELNRRKPGQSSITTPRKEDDTVEIVSGVFEEQTTGTPIALIIYNKDQRSADYGDIKEKFRPGHADYTYWMKYGIRDYRGGGRSSGRETVARVAAGAVAKQLLNQYGIKITAYTKKIGSIESNTFIEEEIEKNKVRCADPQAAIKMEALIEQLAQKGDSCGGIVECKITGVPAGLGEPVFDKLDAELAKAILSIGAVKGIEFGLGFKTADLFGSQNNDSQGEEGYSQNNGGGIEGGISNGNTIEFRLAVKPTASISLKQKTINTQLNSTEIAIQGRHDPCICPRIVPVVEAMSALVLADMLLLQQRNLAQTNTTSTKRNK